VTPFLVPIVLAAAPTCQAACTHMFDVARREFEAAQPEVEALLQKKAAAEHVGDGGALTKKLLDEAAAAEPERMKTCLAQCDEGQFSPGCVLSATTKKGYLPCLRGLHAPAPHAEQADRPPGVPPAESAELLRALDGATAASRLPLLAARLADRAPPPYGSALSSAFQVLRRGGTPAERRGPLLEALAGPLAQLGCTAALARALPLATPLQGAALAKACVPERSLLTPGREKGVAVELVALALLMEAAARQGGFEQAPLHLRAMELVLGG
jgi:hypothetical protein